MDRDGARTDQPYVQEQPVDALLVLFRTHGERATAAGQSWVLHQPETTIGRLEDNDVVIPDRWVSRHHARILRQETKQGGQLHYVIEDLNSTNGLYVNGKRVTAPHALQDGDRIQVSPGYALAFVDSEATAPLFQDEPWVRIDEGARRVWVLGREVLPPLSSAQFALLKALTDAPGRVFSRDELIPIVWPGEDPAGITNEAVSSLVRRLRRRLMAVDPNHRYIIAVRGHGFKFESPDALNDVGRL